ncbi:MAG: porin family protein [Bradymonadales bacterium]|nr:porin family protein [Bradymonadales bacterium]
MNRTYRTLIGLLVMATLSLPTLASAQHVRQGIEIMGGVGLNFCLDSGQANCDTDTVDLGTSWAVLLSGGYRFLPIIGASLDLSYGRLSVDLASGGDGSFYSLTIMPTVRGYTTFRQGEVFIGGGVGYSRFGIEENNVDSSWSNWLNLKLTAGGDYNINNNLAIGLNLEYIFNFDESGQYCTEATGTEICSDSHDFDILDLIQVTIMFKYVIPYNL